MDDEPKIERLPPDEWWPPEYEKRSGCELLMEFPKLVRSLQTIEGRLFVTLEDGQVVDITDLTGEAKH